MKLWHLLSDEASSESIQQTRTAASGRPVSLPGSLNASPGLKLRFSTPDRRITGSIKESDFLRTEKCLKMPSLRLSVSARDREIVNVQISF